MQLEAHYILFHKIPAGESGQTDGQRDDKNMTPPWHTTIYVCDFVCRSYTKQKHSKQKQKQKLGVALFDCVARLRKKSDDWLIDNKTLNECFNNIGLIFVRKGHHKNYFVTKQTIGFLCNFKRLSLATK